MQFKEYNKIHRLGKEETDGILIGKCYIQEKVDGANVQIWKDETGKIRMGSRSKEITEGFNGFCEYVNNDTRISSLLNMFPEYRLYGEWLVRHTIQYSETAYKQFYLFDIENIATGTLLELNQVKNVAEQFALCFPQIFAVLENPTVEQIMPFVGKTNLGEKGEGVVIKNPAFINMFGINQYAKIVTQEFKEDNGLVFGGNNKHSDTYWEMYVVNKYITLERVQKIMNKLQPLIDKKLDFEHTSRIASTTFHDMLTEEIWEISKKVVSVNFKKLSNLCTRKAAQIYKDILNNSISVADQNHG